MTLPFSKSNLAICVLILGLPFAVCFWLVPGVGELTIGNDYRIFSIQHQMEMNYSLQKGTFPLYAPGFAGGRSSAALTLSQLYHPISHMSRLTPGYWDGHALSVNTFYRLLSVGFCHLALFLLARRMKLPLAASFFISFVTVYNLRMLDNFRYGASLENHTGYLLLGASLIATYLARSCIRGPVAVMASTYLLVTGGHPQMMYLGLVGAALVALFTPFVVSAIVPDDPLRWKRAVAYWGRMLGLVAAGVMLAAPYVSSFYFEFVADNAARIGKDYKWSLAYCDTWGGGLRSLFAPLGADVHGAFGGTFLWILPFFIPVLLVLRQRVPIVMLLLVGTLAAIVLASLGDATPLHFWLWKYLPLADTFRTPGRFSMWLLLLFFFVLAWLFSRGDTTATWRNRRLPVAPWMPLPVLAAAATILFNERFDDLVPRSSHHTPMTIGAYAPWVDPMVYKLGLAALGLLTLLGIHVPWKPRAWKAGVGALLCLTIVAQTTLVLRHGTWRHERIGQKTLARMEKERSRSLGFRGVPGFGMESPVVTEQMERSILEPRLARFYRDVLTVDSPEALWRAVKRERNGRQAVLLAPESVLPEASRTDRSIDSVTVAHATFNKVDYRVVAGQSGVLAVNTPYDNRWKATLDGVRVPAYRANGNEVAVVVPRGEHRLSLRFESTATLWGSVTSALVLMLVSAWFAARHLSGTRRGFLLGAATTVPWLFLAMWYGQLYSGEHVGTSYEWSTVQLPRADNLAYGKTTSMSSIHSDQMPYFSYGGLGVDGVAGRGFATNKRRRAAWWQVDLGKVYTIGEIVIHDRGSGRRHLPFDVYLSTGSPKLSIFKRIREYPSGSGPWRIQLNGPRARFVRLQSRAGGGMSFAEVEVYPRKP